MMNRIINTLAPNRDYAGELMNTMRIIAAYREQFFTLEACKQNDGVSPHKTVAELVMIDEEQQELMQDMVTFILYGVVRNGTNKPGRSPSQNTKNNAQEPNEKTAIGSDKAITESDQPGYYQEEKEYFLNQQVTFNKRLHEALKRRVNNES